uniref:Uncharacterized protein n=1 Tax=Myripristis murdjan TaxID=586833 RepID=A0A667XAD6_9TELE
MASASYMEDLTCSVCLTIFTDSVSLLCGHFFCRKCITNSLSKKDQCPQCQTTVPKEEKYLPTNHILKSLADKTKEAEKIKREQGDETTGVAQFLCPEHEEKLKLFCETDQQLACIICRDGERHNGHKFKPIREAKGMEHLSDDIHTIESLANTQRDEITKTQVMSQQLMTQISTQFEEMHQFLRQREEEIKNELKEKEREAVEEMTEKLQAMDLALSESRELQVKVTAALEISDSVKFLQSWTEVNNMLTPECLFRPRANDLPVARTSLSLGPYESHLQFFVWKEMLQVVKPRAELLSLRRENTCVTVSDDGRSLLCTQPCCLSGSNLYQQYKYNTDLYGSARTFSVNKFSSGQHYWETEVGLRSYWEIGVKGHFLKYDGQKYVISNESSATQLKFTDRPQKIGIYLNCSSKELSFYDADKMKHVHTLSSSLMSLPVSAYFNTGPSKDIDRNPLTVCWY